MVQARINTDRCEGPKKSFLFGLQQVGIEYPLHPLVSPPFKCHSQNERSPFADHCYLPKFGAKTKLTL